VGTIKEKNAQSGEKKKTPSPNEEGGTGVNDSSHCKTPAPKNGAIEKKKKRHAEHIVGVIVPYARGCISDGDEKEEVNVTAAGKVNQTSSPKSPGTRKNKGWKRGTIGGQGG